MLSTPALVRPHPEHQAADLLAAYLPGSFFYSSARGTLLADGVHTVVPASAGGAADAVTAALHEAVAAGLSDPVVVGAVGFAPGAESSLVVPAVVRRAAGPANVPPDTGAGADRGPEEARGGWSVRRTPEPAEYAAGVRRALGLIGSRELHKVVLARRIELTAAQPVAVPALLTQLLRADPTAYAFAVDVTAPGDPATRTLVGASPELLVSRRGLDVVANPLAGSAPRAGSPGADLARAEALRRSDQDRREHALVTEQVADALGRFCVDLDVPAEPEVVGTKAMWHLSSRLIGRLTDRSVSSPALAEALHPTPAVCGVPQHGARNAITEIEGIDRGYYSGFAGWCDADGDGEWAVSIRCAEVSARTIRLYAGAGIVEGSDPAAELAETSAKFSTLLRALGMGDAL